jgi:hypothetical protein
MRIDSIDLIGEFRIKGVTAANNQFLGLSGSELIWLDAVAGQPGTSIYGTNYVWCNSVAGDPIASGTKLKDAYSASSGFIVSATARGAILVTPGVYDFDTSPLELNLSYIDIVGISSDANSVTLKSSNSNYTLMYHNSVDSGLYNVGLTGGNLLGILGSASTYLRWDNVIVNGNCFYEDNTPTYAFEDLNGEFRNITVRNDSMFAFALDSINGIFDNINFGSLLYKSMFYVANGSIIGTFSNITGLDYYDIFSSGTLQANISNVKVGNGNGFIQSGDIDAKIDGAVLGEITNLGFYGANYLKGIFKNIEIKNVGTKIFVSEYEIDGIFDNIKVLESSNGYIFDNQQSGTISGTFSNISCKNIDGFCTTSEDIIGNFENIKIGNITYNGFKNESLISGYFNNIEVGDGLNAQSHIFNGENINGTFENIKMGDGFRPFYVTNEMNPTSEINGTFENIEIGSGGDAFFSNAGNLYGTYRNIKVDSTTSIFYANDTFQGSFNNINIGTVSGGDIFYSGAGDFSATVSNVEIGNGSYNIFYSGGTFSGTYRNIVVGNVANSIFMSNNTLSIDVQNLKVGNITNTAFEVLNINSNLYSSFRNIELGQVDGNLFYATNGLNCLIDNLKVKSCGANFVRNENLPIYGTYSNIIVYGNITDSAFFSSGYSAIGNFKNIELLGNCQSIGISDGVVDNLKANTYFVNAFVGTIRNSTLDSTSFATPTITVSLDGFGRVATIERCNFSTNNYSVTPPETAASISAFGASVDVKVYLTKTNLGLEAALTNLITTPLNVTY